MANSLPSKKENNTIGALEGAAAKDGDLMLGASAQQFLNES